jgi:hypothetical protein
VLPPEAVATEGLESFVFRQNGEFFERIGVRVLFSDATAAVVPEDGGLATGMYVAQRGAAALNRALKAQADGGGHGHGHDHDH